MFRRKRDSARVRIALSELDRIVRNGPTESDYLALDSVWDQVKSSAWDALAEDFALQWDTVTGQVAATVTGLKTASMGDDSASRFDSAEEALTFISAAKLARARSRDEAANIQAVMANAVRAAHRLGVSKETIIRTSGLARQTVYDMLTDQH